MPAFNYLNIWSSANPRYVWLPAFNDLDVWSSANPRYVWMCLCLHPITRSWLHIPILNDLWCMHMLSVQAYSPPSFGAPTRLCVLVSRILSRWPLNKAPKEHHGRQRVSTDPHVRNQHLERGDVYTWPSSLKKLTLALVHSAWKPLKEIDWTEKFEHLLFSHEWHPRKITKICKCIYTPVSHFSPSYSERFQAFIHKIYMLRETLPADKKKAGKSGNRRGGM
jgi:hypothetical protein